MPSDQSKTQILSMARSISTNKNSDVMLPFPEQQQKVGTVLWLKWNTGPCGYNCLLRPPVCALLLLLSPTHGADKLSPNTQLVHIYLAENIIVHMTGSPVAAVNPRIVQYETLVTAFLWSCICLTQDFLTTDSMPILCCTGIGTNLIYKKEKTPDLFYVLPLCSWLGGLNPHDTILPSSG